MTSVQMATVLSRRQRVQPSSALAEIVLLNEIRGTLAETDPLHSKILALFDDISEGNDTWNWQYEQVLAEARHRLV